MNEALRVAISTVKNRQTKAVPKPWVRGNRTAPRPKNYAGLRAFANRSDVLIPNGPSIYLIQGERSGLVKIGYASNPRVRLAGLQSGSGEIQVILGFLPATKPADEGELHRKFRQHSVHGEWFHPAPEIFAEFGVA